MDTLGLNKWKNNNVYEIKGNKERFLAQNNVTKYLFCDIMYCF